MSILRRYINMIGAANNLNPDDVEKPINVLQFNRRVFKNSQVRIYSGLKWPDMTKPAAERIENPDGSIAKIKFNGHYHTTFNGAPAFAGLAIPVRFSVKPGEKIVWRVRGKTNKKHIGLPVDVWFKQRPPIVSYQVTNLLGSYGSFSVDSNGDGVADGWYAGTQVKQINNGVQFFSDTITSPATRYINTSVNIVQSRKYFVRRLIRATRTSSTDGGLGAMLFYKIGGGAQYIFYQGQRQQFTNEYTSLTANYDYDSLYIYTVQEWNSPTPGTYTVEIDDVLITDLTSMGELPQPLRQFFAPSNITRWDQLATSSNISAINGRVMPGNDWLNILIPYGEGTYTAEFTAYSNYFLTRVIQEYSQDTNSYVLRTGHELDRAQMFAYMLPALATKMRDRIVVDFSTNSCSAIHGNVYFTASSGELLYNKVNRGKNLTLTCSTATVQVLSEDSSTIRFKLTSGGSTVTTGLHIINVEEQF